MDPIQGAIVAMTWNFGRYGMVMSSQGNRVGMQRRIATKGIAASGDVVKDWKVWCNCLTMSQDVDCLIVKVEEGLDASDPIGGRSVVVQDEAVES